MESPYLGHLKYLLRLEIKISLPKERLISIVY
jgi:hypothetical protein